MNVPQNVKQIIFKILFINYRMDKQWHIHTTEHYSGIKRKALIIHSTGIQLKSIMVSERIQTQKATCYMILFIAHA